MTSAQSATIRFATAALAASQSSRESTGTTPLQIESVSWPSGGSSRL
jgi:hypothetical protein